MTLIQEPVRFRSLTLELSLKPFFDDTPEFRRAVCRRLFRQWLPLCDQADGVQVMLWTADGSETLDYRGELDAELEWGRYLGGANRWHHAKEQEAADESDTRGIGTHGNEADTDGMGLHRRPYLYRDESAVVTYRWLKNLVTDLKAIGESTLGIPVTVGDTFDPGPEFSRSPFKYERHREICLGGALYARTVVGRAATPKGDDTAYPAFPDGIPEGTSLGTFPGSTY